MDFFAADNWIMVWLVIPFLIFIARILDVSIGTMRIILLSKGYRVLAPALGFIESIVWIIAVSQIMQNLNNFYYYIAYAAGYSAGTYIGIVIEQKLSLGQVMVRIVTRRDAHALLEHLREHRYSATAVDAEGKYGDVKIIFIIIKRSDLEEVINTIKQFNPNAFFTIEDVRTVSGGVFPGRQGGVFKRKTVSRKAFNIRK
ncbi:MAG: DUF2179 domain-containing protein [Candidatus Kapaibacterium sp.]